MVVEWMGLVVSEWVPLRARFLRSEVGLDWDPCSPDTHLEIPVIIHSEQQHNDHNTPHHTTTSPPTLHYNRSQQLPLSSQPVRCM